MKEYLENLPDPVGQCPKCEINLYKINEDPEPVVIPCGIKDCPFESNNSR